MALTNLRVTAFPVIQEFFAKQVNSPFVQHLNNENKPVCGSDIGECTSAPCQNNGTCVDEINAFICICMSGYTGDVCETSENYFLLDVKTFSYCVAFSQILTIVRLHLARTEERALI